jgi:ParB family chromosome partitioning protein
MTRHEEWAAAYGDFGQQPQAQLTQLPLDILDAWQGANGEHQPFRLYSEEKLNELAESIRQHGVIEPICVRLKPDSRFEIVAGHNRVAAARIAGLRTVPANVQTLDDTQAALMLVDSNLQHRDVLLPSEKAFAYKLRLDCLKRQGQRTDLTSVQIEQKLTSREAVAAEMGESASSIQRYIRLTNLIPPLLDMVDAGKPGFAAAVELSYLSEERQQLLLKVMAETEKKPNTSQAKALRKASDSGYWSEDQVKRILFLESSPMPKMIQLPTEQLQRFFPADTSPAEMADVLMAALTEYRLRHSESGANSAMSGLSDA